MLTKYLVFVNRFVTFAAQQSKIRDNDKGN